MAAITTPTGATIINIAGSQVQHVGRFTAVEIDQDVTDNTPYSQPELLEAEIRTLITAAGLNPDSLTAVDHGHATTALLWACWIYYWELSRQGDGCPEECADPEMFYKKRNWACKVVCSQMKLLSLSIDWSRYCSGKNSSAAALVAMGANAVDTCITEGYITDRFN